VICPPTNIKIVMILRSRRRDKNVARIAAILFRNLETRLRRRWDSNAINFEEIIWGSVVRTETKSEI
jgi:hypothetical protein